MEKSVITLNRFIAEEERKHPEATGEFSNILQDVTVAAKVIHRAVNKAGLVDVLGKAGRENVHGEQVRKLDEYAHDVLIEAVEHAGHLCVMASEESERLIPIPDDLPVGDYVLLFDPLDGSSNIDANISIGTIFSIHRRITDGGGRKPSLEDALQPGVKQVAAGYVLYGSSTMLVYTTANGVHGFTLDPSIGEFVLSHRNIRIPEPGRRIYSVNEGNFRSWFPGQQDLVRYFRGEGHDEGSFKLRYVGSLVADFHRTLLYGGIFMYPGSRGSPQGKLRLLYETAPLAMICEHAGGAATDGIRRIMEIRPEKLHQRTPFVIGSREYVELAGRFLAEDGAAAMMEEGGGEEGRSARTSESREPATTG